MTSPCDIVLERIALGEPLAELGEHAASCENCRRVVALPVELGQVHGEADPGLGFTARMTAGAQHRVQARRRRRLATGLAFAVVASAAGVVVMTHHGEPAHPVATTPSPATETHPPTVMEDASDDELQTLVELADVDTASHTTANWNRITKPLAPYRKLAEGTTP